MYLIVFQRLILEAVFDIFYFPLWWYTFGLARAGQWAFSLLKRGNRTLAPGLWLKNLFVPMYGQHDFEGRLISFIMRVIEVFIRSIILFVWLIICLVLWLVWLALPALLAYACFKTFIPAPKLK